MSVLNQVREVACAEAHEARAVAKLVLMAVLVLPPLAALISTFLPRELATVVVILGLLHLGLKSLIGSQATAVIGFRWYGLLVAALLVACFGVATALLTAAVALMLGASPMWALLLVASVAGLVTVVALARRNEAEVARDWAILLSWRQATLQQEDDLVELQPLVSIDETKELLDAGYKVLEYFSPSMFGLLVAMSTFSRMVSAMAPVDQHRPHSTRVSTMNPITSAAEQLRSGFSTTWSSLRDRVDLHIYVMIRSLALAFRVFFRSVHRVLTGSPGKELRWEESPEAIAAGSRATRTAAALLIPVALANGRIDSDVPY